MLERWKPVTPRPPDRRPTVPTITKRASRAVGPGATNATVGRRPAHEQKSLVAMTSLSFADTLVAPARTPDQRG